MDDPATQKRKRASREAERAMIAAAHRGETITYVALTGEIKSVQLLPNSQALESILTRLSRLSNKGGLGMLSVVVVNQDTGLPGQGFFELAHELGRKVENQDEFFNAEFDLVCQRFKDIEDRIPPASPG